MIATFHRHAAWARLGPAVLLASPPLRSLLEARMASHMLLQFPLLMLARACLAHAAPPALQRRLAAWNAHGIAGLTLSAGALALSMVPRLLDLALTHPTQNPPNSRS